MKKIIGSLSVLAVVMFASTAMAKPGACFYNASGALKGRDSCRADKVITPCSKNNPSAMCKVGKRGSCQKTGDYTKFIIVDRSNGFNCPKKY